MMKGQGSSIRLLLIGVSLVLPGGVDAFARDPDEPPVAHLNDAAKQRTPQELVRRYKESVDSIRTLRAEMRVVTGREFPAALEGLKRDDSGRVIAYEAKRDWEAATRRYRLERSALRRSAGLTLPDNPRPPA